jgi:16S rRNA (uracil1498-N3)-methyltransferase
MGIPRFYVPAGLAAGNTVELPQTAAHHALRVLRLRDGAPIVLFDGQGQEFAARLQAPDANVSRSRALVGDGGAVDRECATSVTLVQALSAQDKIDWLVEKAVELGAVHVVLTPAARSVVRLEPARQQRRQQRLQDIAVAACCQCGRNRIPRIEIADGLEQALRQAGGAAARWILEPDAADGLPVAAAASISVAIGPEGGFTPQELALARSLDYLPVRLGPRVLRTETAGLAAISAALALQGEYTPR